MNGHPQAGAFLRALGERLRNPALCLPVEGLMDLWQHDEAVVEADLPADFEECPDMNARIRGALMAQLHACRDIHGHDHDPFGRPCAWDMLDAWRPPADGALELGRPHVVHCTASGTRIVIRVRLFGLAGWYAPIVHDCLIAALQGGVQLRGRGIGPTGASPERRSKGTIARFRIRHSGIHRVEGILLPAHVPTAGQIRLMSPLQVRRDRSVVLDPVAIVRAAVRRVAAAAPWMGVRLMIDESQLGQALGNVRFDMSNVHPIRFDSFSRRQPGTAIPVHALGGMIRLSGPLLPLLPYLALAEMTGAGSSTAKGFGQLRFAAA